MIKTIPELFDAVNRLEERFAELGYSNKRLVEASIKRSFRIEAQVQTLNFPIIGYCVSTIDPLNLDRVRVFHPLLSEPDTKISGLPFARSCNNQGGTDDCGGTWVPPAGSSVVIVCENGDRQCPIYLGTVWQKNRGPQASSFPYPMDEFYKLWKGENYRGDGYLVGATDGSQAHGPWDTEKYNNQNFDNEKEIDTDPDAQQKITYPNIYGWKTPGKHMIKLVDGDYRCNNKWSRFEMMSKTGIWFMMKDDYFHPAGEWANPLGIEDGESGTIDTTECDSVSALTSLNVSGVEDEEGDFTGQIIGGDGNTGSTVNSCKPAPSSTPVASNPYFKRLEECRPYQGAPTPQNNKIALPQSGAQLQTLSGHQIVMDDSVNQPLEEKISWKRKFGFGCDNIFKGKMFMKSATGHYIGMNDSETLPEIRDENNGIEFRTACGHYFKMIDDTAEGCIAGDQRALSFGSTSGHTFEMVDQGNEQCSPTRKEGGIPVPKAKQAFVQLRTGYGLVFRMDDSTSQEETRNQFIMLAANPKEQTDSCNGQPHTLLMQLEEGGGGFVELTSGGKFIFSTRGDSLESIGTDECPANKLSQVFGSYLLSAKEFVFTKSKIRLDLADKYIILGAGQDCEINQDDAEETGDSAIAGVEAALAAANETGTSQQTMGPCFFPIIIARDPQVCPLTNWVHWMSYSNRVLASSG